MTKYIRNKSVANLSLRGRTITPGEFYLIPPSELGVWGDDDAVISTLSDPSVATISLDGQTDFSNQASRNISILQKNFVADPDTGGLSSSPRYAPDGWYQKMHEFQFQTSKLASLEDEKPDLNEYGYGSLKFFDASGIELTTQASIDTSCVMTQLDWIPTHDFMALSGYAQQATIPTTRCKIWGLGAPEIPSIYGGSQVFVDGSNLQFEAVGAKVGLEGVAGTIMRYAEPLGVGNGHTNHIQFRVWTPDQTGYKHDIQIKLSMFVPPGS